LDVKPELGLSLNIYLSKQFDRYFDNEEVKAFLKEKYNEYEDAFLIGLVYKENRNGKILFDMLPCFTETSKKDEDLKDTAKRLVEEEVFSSWEGSNFAIWYNNNFKKEIYAVEKRIDDVEIDYIESKNSDNTKDDVSRKVALYLWGYNIDNGIKFFDANGTKLPDAVEVAIEARLNQPLATVDGPLLGRASRVNDAAGRYIEFCKHTLRLGTDLSRFHIVLDCAHGAAYVSNLPFLVHISFDMYRIAT